jgi:acetyltransferase-like isoleucine patch superfamily enzyme
MSDERRIAHTAMIAAGVYVGQAQVGEFAVIGEGAVIEDGAIVGAHCVVGNGAIIGQKARVGENSTVLPGVTVGYGARVGSGSVVTRVVHPRTLKQGNPARFCGFVCAECGAMLWDCELDGPLRTPLLCECGAQTCPARRQKVGVE